MSMENTSSTLTAFRQAEKHFKNRANKDIYPSLRQWQDRLIDLSRPDSQEEDEIWAAGWWSPDHDIVPVATNGRRRKGIVKKNKGERPELDTASHKSLPLHGGKTGYIVAPGCILIPGYLTAKQQLSFLYDSLVQYTLPPNPLSLSTHYDLPPDLFSLFVSDPEATVLPKHMTGAVNPEVLASASQPKSRKLNDTEPASVIGYEEIIARNKAWTGDVPSDKLEAKEVRKLWKEIRWANLGWVYQWSTKSYDFTPETPIAFPAPLAELCSEAVASVPWENVFSSESDPDAATYGWQSWPRDYKPDTGIVNFYQLNDTLMAHVDRAELDPARPLVSVSLGHAAILLLGSDSRDEVPRPIILRSGDMLIMSGKGRQAYHGVPRILEGSLPSHFLVQESDSENMKAAKNWISTARININARQVFPPGFERLK
ncbi:alkylated DNA repair protein AlkB [Cryptococcus tetragattii IND107]|uniref:Alkylated DNA repair protein AlkB n=1 Tax=Cryptococcus tetragattii IND107 TaxID=1296105 RepID=A0ABR3BK06_9TREE